MALSFCMLINMLIIMKIMQIRSFVCMLLKRTCRPLADWRSGVIVLATVSGRSAVGPRRLLVCQMFPPA